MDYEGKGLEYGDADDRIGFVKKVYLILFTQLAITAGFAAIAINSLTMASWMYDNWWLELVLVIVAIIIEIALICNRTLARAVPANYIALLLFTLCESYMVAFFCMYYVYEPEPTF